MKKILVIGQAPPIQKQKLPYDTTMLYNWLEKCGVSKEDAINTFAFDAVYDKFPGTTSSGGHKKPNKQQMKDYWNRELSYKFETSNKVILLGRTSYEFICSANIIKKPWGKLFNILDKEILVLPHPSYRNASMVKPILDELLNNLKTFINK